MGESDGMDPLVSEQRKGTATRGLGRELRRRGERWNRLDV
jgi:hypothetical protein